MGKDLREKYREGDVDGILDELVGGAQKLQEKENELAYGPLPKNQATMDFEYIIEKLADPVAGKNARFTFDKESNTYFLQIANKNFNLSDILKNMDMRFLEISDKAKDQIGDKFKHGEMMIMPTRSPDDPSGVADEKYFEEKDKDGKYKDLHYAEKASINIYTGQFYGVMNNLLRGEPPGTLTQLDLGYFHDYSHGPTATFNLAMQTTLIAIAMSSTGLNKIPNEVIDVAFRGESLDPHIRRQRLDSVEKPGVVTIERGFISTSMPDTKDKKGTVFTRDDNTLFHGLIGKNIQGLSANPHEREFLMPPTQVKWEAVKKDGNSHYFVAKPVYTTSGLTQEQRELGASISAVDKLLAEVKNIKSIYDAQPGNSKPHFWRAHQIKSLAEAAEKIAKNPELTSKEQLDAITAKLNSVKSNIKTEQKIKNFLSFGLADKKESKLEQSITFLLNPNAPRKTSDDGPKKLNAVLTIDDNMLKNEYDKLKANEPKIKTNFQVYANYIAKGATDTNLPYLKEIKSGFSAIESNKKLKSEEKAELAYALLSKIQADVEKINPNAKKLAIYGVCEKYKGEIAATYPKVTKQDSDPNLRDKKIASLQKEVSKQEQHEKKHGKKI